MPFTVVKNRLPELIQVLQDTSSKDRHKQILRPMASETGIRLMTMFREAGPIGRTEPDYPGFTGTVSHGRPSIRLHGTTLSRSWGYPETKELSDGVGFTIGTTTRLYEILYKGSPAHTYRGKPWLSFWHFKTANPFLTPKPINHPGFAPKNFVETTWFFRGRTFVISKFNQARRLVLSPLRQFFGGS